MKNSSPTMFRLAHSSIRMHLSLDSNFIIVLHSQNPSTKHPFWEKNKHILVSFVQITWFHLYMSLFACRYIIEGLWVVVGPHRGSRPTTLWAHCPLPSHGNPPNTSTSNLNHWITSVFSPNGQRSFHMDCMATSSSSRILSGPTTR